MKNAEFCDVAPCGSSKNWSFGGIYGLYHQVKRNSELGTTLAVISN
jgi:hypothetical protein